MERAVISTAPTKAAAVLPRLGWRRASVHAKRAAANRAARAAVVTFAAFAIGRWWIDDVPLAVFATFTGLALSGIADFGGTLRGRFMANASAVAAGVGLTALGTWISSRNIWIACAVMFAVVAVIALSSLLGGYAAFGANAVILFYVVAAGSAAPTSQLPDRIEGVLLGGALATVAALVLWPEAATAKTLPAIAAAVMQLADRLRALAEGTSTGIGARVHVRMAVDALVDRPAAPTTKQRAELYLINDIERLDGLVARLEGDGVGQGELSMVGAAALVLEQTAGALGQQSWADLPVESPTATEPFSVVGRLVSVTTAIVSDARAVLGSPAEGTATTARADFRHGVRRFVANLTLRSVHVHDALRLGAGLAAATAAVDVFGLQHGFWVAFATLTVVKTNVRATGRSVFEAIAGTVIGFALAFALIGGLEPGINWYVALLPIVVAMAIYANVAVSFAAGQAGFTLTIIVLFNLLGPAGWRIGIVRVEDVAAGAVIGLIIGALAWPRGATAAIAGATADLVDAAGAYVAESARAFVGRAEIGPDQVREEAAAAIVRAESAFAQFLSEHPTPEDAMRRAGQLAIANRLWYVGDLIRRAADDRRQRPEATAAAALRIKSETAAFAAALRGKHLTPVREMQSAPEYEPGTLAQWLEELAADVGTATR